MRMNEFTTEEQGTIEIMRESMKAFPKAFPNDKPNGGFIVSRIERLACCGRVRAKTLIQYVLKNPE